MEDLESSAARDDFIDEMNPLGHPITSFDLYYVYCKND